MLVSIIGINLEFSFFFFHLSVFTFVFSDTDSGDPNQELNAKDAAAVRADHPIPITCGVYYFEVTIVCSGAECCMGVGLCERNVDLNRLPGLLSIHIYALLGH